MLSFGRLQRDQDFPIGRLSNLWPVRSVRTEVGLVRHGHGRSRKLSLMLGIYRRATAGDGLHKVLRKAAAMVRHAYSAFDRKLETILKGNTGQSTLQVGLTAVVVGNDTIASKETMISRNTILAGFAFPTVGLFCLVVRIHLHYSAVRILCFRPWPS